MLYIALARGVLFHTKSTVKPFQKSVDILAYNDDSSAKYVKQTHKHNRLSDPRVSVTNETSRTPTLVKARNKNLHSAWELAVRCKATKESIDRLGTAGGLANRLIYGVTV